MRSIVLEPDGNHWSVDLLKPESGFCRAVEVGYEPAPRMGIPLPIYEVVHYQGHQFLDNHGNCYWIFVRAK